jgi:pimeloyl-ACP methyl ester carboxylesterase
MVRRADSARSRVPSIFLSLKSYVRSAHGGSRSFMPGRADTGWLERVMAVEKLRVNLALLGLVAGSLVFGVGLWANQARLIFEPDRRLRAAPADFPFPVVEVAIPVRPQDKAPVLRGWWMPSARPGAKVVLYLHGNDGNVTTSVGEAAPLLELGYSVLMIDYRGYGASDGPFPSEASVYEDAEAGWRHLLRGGAKPGDVFIYGHSLGAAIAIELALRHPEAAGLIAESAFTSIRDMALLEPRYAVLPLSLLNQRFDSLDKVPALRLPSLFIHGTADEVVPYSMGLQLFGASAGTKQFLAVEGGRHGDNARAGGSAFRAAIERFVEDSADVRH